MLTRLFKPRPAKAAGHALYARAVEQARSPALYQALGAPDTPEGRFEVYSLHVNLLIERLRAEGEEGVEVSQALFDAYSSGLDHGLREMGVGDLSVGKKMRRLGEAVMGRAKSYQEAIAALPDRGPLEAMLGRTVYADATDRSQALADYVLSQREALTGQSLVGGQAAWRPA